MSDWPSDKLDVVEGKEADVLGAIESRGGDADDDIVREFLVRLEKNPAAVPDDVLLSFGTERVHEMPCGGQLAVAKGVDGGQVAIGDLSMRKSEWW